MEARKGGQKRAKEWQREAILNSLAKVICKFLFFSYLKTFIIYICDFFLKNISPFLSSQF